MAAAGADSPPALAQLPRDRETMIVPVFKSQHRRLTIRSRLFHFVSHEGRPANFRRAELGYPPMWYLMVDGRRCPVLPYDSAQPLPELDAALRSWAGDNALGPVDRVV